jgi:hypothetical protein
MPSDDRVDADEYVDILREAVAARNGWKRILARCAPAKKRISGSTTCAGDFEVGIDDRSREKESILRTVPDALDDSRVPESWRLRVDG